VPDAPEAVPLGEGPPARQVVADRARGGPPAEPPQFGVQPARERGADALPARGLVDGEQRAEGSRKHRILRHLRRPDDPAVPFGHHGEGGAGGQVAPERVPGVRRLRTAQQLDGVVQVFHPQRAYGGGACRIRGHPRTVI
jgi:hypothetical protein